MTIFPTPDKPTVVVHESITETPAGQYTQARINIEVLRDKIEETETVLQTASAEAKSSSADAAFTLLQSLPPKLKKLCDMLKGEYAKAEDLEDKTTVEAYAESLDKFHEAYDHASDRKPLPAGDQKVCNAIMRLQERLEDDADDWSEVSGSKEASWLEAAVKAAGLQHRVEKQEEQVKAIKQDTAPAPEEKGKKKRMLSEKDKADRHDKTTSIAILDSLKKEHKTAQDRADLMGKDIDPDKADKLVDMDLKKMAKLRNLRPSVLIRKILLTKIKMDLKRKREDRRAARVEGIVESIVDQAEAIQENGMPAIDITIEQGPQA